MIIPQSNTLTTRHLNRVFDKTVATYKYYWFLGILDLYVKQGKTRMNVWDIMILMVTNAWYPVNYFRLSFGKSESLYETILTLQEENNIPINIGVRELMDLLQTLIQRKDVRKKLNFLQLNVPFRFLRPWIDTSDDRDMVKRSQAFENGCLYRLKKELEVEKTNNSFFYKKNEGEVLSMEYEKDINLSEDKFISDENRELNEKGVFKEPSGH